jgi:hypothetical protein
LALIASAAHHPWPWPQVLPALNRQKRRYRQTHPTGREQWRAIGLLCDIPFGTLYGLFARWTRLGLWRRMLDRLRRTARHRDLLWCDWRPRRMHHEAAVPNLDLGSGVDREGEI